MGFRSESHGLTGGLCRFGKEEAAARRYFEDLPCLCLEMCAGFGDWGIRVQGLGLKVLTSHMFCRQPPTSVAQG